MRARLHGLAPLAALAAGAALGACGGGLYDSKGVPQLAAGGECGFDTVSCVVSGADQCLPQDSRHCGTGCLDCGTAAPLHAVAACLREGGAPGLCGFECTDGYLKCGAACCGTTALAAGDKTTCALLEDGEVACWGANEAGQTGDGTTATPRTAPHLVPLGGRAVAIGVGVSHACAAMEDGSVRCWGRNASGQVTGTPAASPALAPVASPVGAGSGATAVVAGGAHTCALLAGGAVRCWGSNVAGQLGPGPGQPVAAGAAALASGFDHACALVGGAVQCWGKNDLGQLGNGTTTTPAAGTVTTPIASGVQQLAAGMNHTCAGKPSNGTNLDDALQCWGDSVGANWLLASPQKAPAIPRKDTNTATIRYGVALLAAGGRHVCVSKGGAEIVECLGDDAFGQLGGAFAGGSDTVPLVLPTVGAKALGLGAAHTCAASTDGRLRCWGANDYGQLGDGTTVTPVTGTAAVPLGR